MKRLAILCTLALLAQACSRDLTRVRNLSGSCADNELTGDETDIDCGGSCDPCADLASCLAPTDCASGVCTDQICQVPTCTDDAVNGLETALNCGGSVCDPCADGSACLRNDDCLSQACDADTNTCLRVHVGNVLIRQSADFAQLNAIDVLEGSLDIQCPGACTIPTTWELFRINGSVSIFRSTELQNVDGLAALEEVTGDFEIIGNTLLENLEGLANLTEVGGSLDLQENPSLSTIQGLRGLVETGGLRLVDQESLTSLQGLQNLQAVEGDLWIIDADGLTTIANLSALRIVEGDFRIEDNDLLESVAGLGALQDIGGDLDIVGHDYDGPGNGLLTVQGFGALQFIGGRLRIMDNIDLEGVQGFGELVQIGGDFEVVNHEYLDTIGGFGKLTFVGGGFYIHGNDFLVNLGGFGSLRIVEGLLMVGCLSFNDGFDEVRVGLGNYFLESINGFQNLTRAGALAIGCNDCLLDVRGFDSLQELDGTISLRADHQLHGYDPDTDVITLITQPQAAALIRKAKSGLFIHENFELDTLGERAPIDGIDPVLFTGVDTISITDSDVFWDLEFLSGIEDMEGDLILRNLPDVTDLVGLGSLGVVEGSVILENLSISSLMEVSGISELSGSLTLADLPDLTDLQGLGFVTSVGGDLTIKNCQRLMNLSHLASLQTVGGTFHLEGTTLISDLSDLTALTQAGTVTLRRNAGLTSVDLAQVRLSLGLEVTSNAALATVAGPQVTMPNITALSRDVVFTQNVELTTVTGFDDVTSVRNVSVTFNAALQSFQMLSSLTDTAGNLVFQNNGSLDDLGGMAPVRVGGDLRVFAMAGSTDVNNFSTAELTDARSVALRRVVNAALPKLTRTTGDVVLDGCDAITLSLDELSTIGGNLEVKNCGSLTDLTAPKLTVAGTRLEITMNDVLDTLSFPVLAAVGGDVVITNNLVLPECDADAICGAVGATSARCNTAGNDSPCIPDPCGAMMCVKDCAQPMNFSCQ